MHGRASGIDAATVNSDKPLWFIRDKVTEPLDIELTGFLVIGDSGVRGLTTQAISIVQQKLKEFPEAAELGIQKLGTLAREAKTYLAEDNAIGLGEVMTQSQEILKSLDVSHPKLDRLITEAKNKGALGAKLTGSGLGGVILALARSERDAIQISQALSRNGALNTWIFSL
jgi:mevalonate kinase